MSVLEIQFKKPVVAKEMDPSDLLAKNIISNKIIPADTSLSPRGPEGFMRRCRKPTA